MTSKEEAEPPLAPPNSSRDHACSTPAASSSATLTKDALERRAKWLQEDLQVMKQRANALLPPDVGTPRSSGSQNEGVVRLQSIAHQLLGELAEEREWREGLEAQVNDIENQLLQERARRAKELASLSHELEEAMKSLYQRIDSGLGNSTRDLNARAAKTETVLKSLIVRVEEGLQSGAKALQETLASDASGSPKDATKPSLLSNVMQSIMAPRLPGPEPLPPFSSGLQVATMARPQSVLSELPTLDESSDNLGSVQGAIDSTNSDASFQQAAKPLYKEWGQLQEENLRLRQARVQLEARQLRSRLTSRTASQAGSQAQSKAATPHGSRNRSPEQHGMQLGTGFRGRARLSRSSAPSTSPVRERPQAASNDKVIPDLSCYVDNSVSNPASSAKKVLSGTSVAVENSASPTALSVPKQAASNKTVSDESSPKAPGQNVGFGLTTLKQRLESARDSSAASTASSLLTLTAATTSADGGCGVSSRPSVLDSSASESSGSKQLVKAPAVPPIAASRLAETWSRNFRGNSPPPPLHNSVARQTNKLVGAVVSQERKEDERPARSCRLSIANSGVSAIAPVHAPPHNQQMPSVTSASASATIPAQTPTVPGLAPPHSRHLSVASAGIAALVPKQTPSQNPHPSVANASASAVVIPKANHIACRLFSSPLNKVASNSALMMQQPRSVRLTPEQSSRSVSK